MPPRSSAARPLGRAAVVALVAGVSCGLGLPAAAAAEDERPVLPLDPPDVAVFLVPQENAGLFGGADLTVVGGAPAAVADALPAPFAAAAAVLPDEVASAVGVQSEVGPQSHGMEGLVDVEYGNTVTLRVPPPVDLANVEVTLELAPPDPDDPGRTYQSDAPLPADRLTVTPQAGNELLVTLPADDGVYGPEAILTVDRLGSTEAEVAEVFGLDYFLEFAPGAGPVTLEPLVGVFAQATCPVDTAAPCDGPTVRAGSAFDLTVPPTSLLRDFGYGDLSTAVVTLMSGAEDAGVDDVHDSLTTPELLTVHRPGRATVHVPDTARPGPFFGTVLEGTPGTGVAFTVFELEVEAVPDNPGLRSDTGWVEEVRGATPGSTAAVAGGALLLVGGITTLVAVRPGRRPPLGG